MDTRRTKPLIKRLLSSAMALAVALSMCMVSIPVKARGYYYFYNTDSDSAVASNGFNAETSIFAMDPEGTNDQTTPSVPEQLSWNKATKQLTFKGSVALIDLAVVKDNSEIVISGKGNSIRRIDLFTEENRNDCALKIKMNPGAELSIGYSNTDVGPVYFQGTATQGETHSVAEAIEQKKIIIVNGKIDPNSNPVKIVNDGTGQADTPDDGKKDGTDETVTEVKEGEEYCEAGKDSKTSPTYVTTSTNKDNRTVTYGKPAENTGEIAEVPDEVTLPDGQNYKVTEIKANAFSGSGCKSTIREVHIGNNVSSIGDSAFEEMPELEKVYFGICVQKIGNRAFFKCIKLKTAELPESLEEIGDSAFEETGLVTVIIKKNVRRIGTKAFFKAKKLGKVTIMSTYFTKKNNLGKNAFGKTAKKLKIKLKFGKGKKAKKTKEKVIKVFKNKRVGYKNTWKIS